MFPLLARRNEFVGTPMEAPFDGSITRDPYRGDTRDANNYREHIREDN
jgi:hypothetical protein